eukprot:scaffold120021_cov32-Tisochrysis_lutea.AAC.1
MKVLLWCSRKRRHAACRVNLNPFRPRSAQSGRLQHWPYPMVDTCEQRRPFRRIIAVIVRLVRQPHVGPATPERACAEFAVREAVHLWVNTALSHSPHE